MSVFSSTTCLLFPEVTPVFLRGLCRGNLPSPACPWGHSSTPKRGPQHLFLPSPLQPKSLTVLGAAWTLCCLPLLEGLFSKGLRTNPALRAQGSSSLCSPETAAPGLLGAPGSSGSRAGAREMAAATRAAALPGAPLRPGPRGRSLHRPALRPPPAHTLPAPPPPRPGTGTAPRVCAAPGECSCAAAEGDGVRGVGPPPATYRPPCPAPSSRALRVQPQLGSAGEKGADSGRASAGRPLLGQRAGSNYPLVRLLT
uniref:Uncharacterized protein n=1 Tax=Canis lupus dingo TaxID=286419 RepID=A0A8C0K902_CANLU